MTFYCILASIPAGAIVSALVGPSSDPNYAALADNDARIAAYQLAQEQAQQTAAVKSACSAAIQGGFGSKALGASYTYPTTLLDQQNMQASCIDAQRTPASWQAGTAYLEGADVMAGATRLLATAGGTSGATQPTGAGTDGTVTWAAWSTPFWVMDASGNWTFTTHTAAQILQAGADLKAFIVACQKQCASLVAQIAAATTISEIQAVTWSAPSGVA